MNVLRFSFFTLFLLVVPCLPVLSQIQETQASFTLEYEKYTLDNGLEVILHVDRSDPIVAVATLVHVGSNREKPGRTGFAHFFEHMSFNDSENVPRGANRKLIPELGGERNGGTWEDGTIYYEVVPKDAFEKILWIDSDRLGFMINTVTESALEREKQVVKNEKRERVDNVPYGHTNTVIREHLYPQEHPYHWTVIGSLPDLQAATLTDVKEFYNKYYGANNVTLVIAGDIDVKETKKLVDRWFGEIRRGPEVESLVPQPVSLNGIRSLYHEDTFAKLPELRMVFPSVQQYHPDTYALKVLAKVLAGSKKSPLYNVIVEEKKLAPDVTLYFDEMELAGELVLRIRANDGVDLDSVLSGVEEAFARFEQNKFTETELQRIKAEIETDLYFGIETVLNKAFQLAIYNEYAGDPGYISVEAQRLQAVKMEDVVMAFQRYVKDRPYILTSFVPQGQLNLIVDGAQEAQVYEEPIIAGKEAEEVSQGAEADYEKTPTKYDRSEPALGKTPSLTTPAVWTEKLPNGISIYGIEYREIPVVEFDLTLSGGHWLDPLDKAGTASLLADMMLQGTQKRTPAELEEAIGLLGATITVEAGDEEIRISGTTLARNFDQTLKLVEETLLEPRWDQKEFDRLKRELLTTIKGQEADPRFISAVAYRRLLYGDKHILGLPVSGIPQTAENIQLQDLKVYYNTNFSPTVATFHFVGALLQQDVLNILSRFAVGWREKNVKLPVYELPASNSGQKVFFIDVPEAKQSVIRIGRLALSAADEDYNNVIFTNQRLGGGSSGRLFQLLRIEKGYTYGAYSFMGSTREVGPFTVYSSVRANVTLESLNLMRDLLKNYRQTFGADELSITKNQIVKSNTRALESVGAKLGMLQRMSKFGLPADYVSKSQDELLGMQLADFHRTIDRYLPETDMFYLVVGDAKTQLERLTEFGYDTPQILDIYGNPN